VANNAVKAVVSVADNAVVSVVDNAVVSVVDDRVVEGKVAGTNLVRNLKPSKPRPTHAFSNTMTELASPPPWPKRAWRSVASNSRAARP